MIAEYGMGTELMSRRLPADDYSVSDATRRLVDDEQKHLTDLAWRHALAVIVEHRPLLDALASTLLEQEVLLRGDIERIVGEERAREAEAANEEAIERSPLAREQKPPPVRAGDVPGPRRRPSGPFPARCPSASRPRRAESGQGCPAGQGQTVARGMSTQSAR